ncbi:hypothetical protein D3C81_2059460 [compost metagenome]
MDMGINQPRNNECTFKINPVCLGVWQFFFAHLANETILQNKALIGEHLAIFNVDDIGIFDNRNHCNLFL